MTETDGQPKIRFKGIGKLKGRVDKDGNLKRAKPPKRPKKPKPVIVAEPPKPPRDPGGRPTKYDPDFVRQAAILCERGATDAEIAEIFDVSTRTLARWKADYPDFCQALNIGKDLCDQRVERTLYQKAVGFHYTEQEAIKVKRDKDLEEVEIVDVEKYAMPDNTSAIFWLKNRRPDRWRDRQENVNLNLTMEVAFDQFVRELQFKGRQAEIIDAAPIAEWPSKLDAAE